MFCCGKLIFEVNVQPLWRQPYQQSTGFNKTHAKKVYLDQTFQVKCGIPGSFPLLPVQIYPPTHPIELNIEPT